MIGIIQLGKMVGHLSLIVSEVMNIIFGSGRYSGVRLSLLCKQRMKLPPWAKAESVQSLTHPAVPGLMSHTKYKGQYRNLGRKAPGLVR